MRLRLDLSYDGTAFHGWARQHGLRTVQGDLEQALDTVLRATGTSVTVAGRTDTGVHASGQLAHISLTCDGYSTKSRGTLVPLKRGYFT